MNSIQIQCFITSAQTLNFTKTAQLLYISQPTVTHHILSLEAELGLQLFERQKKQVFLTPAGEKFYTSIKKITSELDSAILSAKRFEIEYHSHICIGCGSSEFEKDFIPDVISLFREKYPRTYITYNSSMIKEKIKAFQKHEIDILFSTTAMIKNFTNAAYYCLHEYPYVCVMNTDNPLSRLDKISLSDLHDQNMIFANPSTSPPELDLLQKQIEKKHPHNIIYYAENATISHLMILSNTGIGIMPTFKHQKHKNLIAVPYTDCPPISYGIARQKNDDREFIDSFIKITQTVFKTVFSQT